MYIWVLFTFFIGTPVWAFNDARIFNTKKIVKIDDKIVNDVDSTVENLLNSFFPSNHGRVNNFHLKGNLKKNDLKWNITAVGDSISNEIQLLSKQLGLISNNFDSNNSMKFVKINKFDPKASIIHQLLAFPLGLIPIGLETITNLQKLAKKNNYIAKGYAPVKFEFFNNKKDSPGKLKTFGDINNSKHYVFSIYKCLHSPVQFFDIQKACVSIAKYPPKKAGIIVKNHLMKRIPRHPPTNGQRQSEYEAMTCHSITSSEKTFRNCLKELEQLKNCLAHEAALNNQSIAKKSNYYLSPSSIQLVKSFGGFNNRCKLNNQTLKLNCQNDKNITKTIDINSLIKNFTRRSFSSVFAEKFGGNIVSLMFPSNLGENIVDEFGTLAYTYLQGSLKQNKLKKIMRSNVNVKEEYKKLSKSLASYKRDITNAAVGAINDLRIVATTVENTLVDSMSKFLGIDFSEHTRAMKCINKLMDLFLNDLFDIENNYDDFDESNRDDEIEKSENDSADDEDDWEEELGIPEISNDYWELENESKNEAGKAIDIYRKPIGNLIESLKHLTQTNMLRNSSTIAMLANTFLLATMFYECIAILAHAMYRTGPNEPTSTPTINHEENHLHHEDESWEESYSRYPRSLNKEGIQDDSKNYFQYFNYGERHNKFKYLKNDFNLNIK